MIDESSDGAFADVLTSNNDYADHFRLRGLEPIAASGLAVVTCMDSRIEPLTMLGLKPGDAKILRNAGARVTSDVLRTLVLGAHLLGVTRIMVVAHTKCKMSSSTEEEVFEAIEAAGVDARSINFSLVEDQDGALHRDVERIRHWPFLPAGLPVGGFLYDVDTGHLAQVC